MSRARSTTSLASIPSAASNSPVIGVGSRVPRDAASWARCVTAIRLAQAVYRFAENADADAQTFRSLGLDPDTVTIYMRHSADFCVIGSPGDGAVVYIAIQGGKTLSDIRLDGGGDAQPIPDENGCVLHDGLESYAVRILAKLAALDLPAVKKARRVYLCGHGLGGAVAVILSYLLRFNRRPTPVVPADCEIEVATIGAPTCMAFLVNGANAARGRPKRTAANEPEPALAAVLKESAAHRHFVHIADAVPRTRFDAFERTGQTYLLTRMPKGKGRMQLFACPNHVLPPRSVMRRLAPWLSKNRLTDYVPALMNVGADIAAFFEAGGSPI